MRVNGVSSSPSLNVGEDDIPARKQPGRENFLTLPFCSNYVFKGLNEAQ